MRILTMKIHTAIFRFSIIACIAITFLFVTYIESKQTGAEFFTLIVLPDTQNYIDSSFGGKPEYFYKQTRWIKDKKDELNIVMVIHEGDIVQSFTQPPFQWEIADTVFQTIDNEVPYILCLGNHDIVGENKKLYQGHKKRYTLLNNYFPPSRFMNNPLYNNNFSSDKNTHFQTQGKTDNYFLFFEGGGMNFMVIALEFKPRDKILQWADQVAAQYQDRRCIIVTHGYLDTSNELISMDNYKIKGNSAQQMWDKFVSRHENIFLVLCGHILGEGLLTTTGKNGNVVHQVLADFQNDYIGNGGHGYLRIMKFFPENDRIDVQTYSPVLNNYITSPKSQFSLNYHMKGKKK